MNELVTTCFIFALIQVVVCRAQSNDQVTLQSPIQSISKPQRTERSTLSSSGVTDFSNDNAALAPATSSDSTTSTPAYSPSSSDDSTNYIATPIPLTQPAGVVNTPSYIGFEETNLANSANPVQAIATSLIGTVQTPYTSQRTTDFLNYVNAAAVPTIPQTNAANTPVYSSSSTTAFLNHANVAAAPTTPIVNATYTPSSTTGYLNYANTAPASVTPTVNAANHLAYTSSDKANIPNYGNAAPASFNLPLNGFSYPGYSSFYNFGTLSPYYASMSGQFLPYASPYANSLTYGNMQYLANPYYFPQFPMGYTVPQMPYGMIPNPALHTSFSSPTLNLNKTPFNSSLARTASLFPQPLVPRSPTNNIAAPATQDQSMPTVTTSTDESGADPNSLPPQVKEFMDMIPEILDMQESSPLQPAPHEIKHSPSRKYPKPATSPLFKKKQHYPSYPQYSNHLQRYGYYY